MSSIATHKQHVHHHDVREGAVSEIVVHSFIVAEEDVAIFAAQHLYEWEQSDQGKWVMEHAVETPRWTYNENWGYNTKCKIIARLTVQDQVYYQLKWGK
jgi:hypothetical protein